VSVALVDFKRSASLQKLDFFVFSANRGVQLQAEPLAVAIVIDELARKGLRNRVYGWSMRIFLWARLCGCGMDGNEARDSNK